jgi:hypothetical protein
MQDDFWKQERRFFGVGELRLLQKNNYCQWFLMLGTSQNFVFQKSFKEIYEPGNFNRYLI